MSDHNNSKPKNVVRSHTQLGRTGSIILAPDSFDRFVTSCQSGEPNAALKRAAVRAQKRGIG